MPAKTQPEPEKKLSKSALKLRLLKRLKCTTRYEKLAWASGAKLVAGVDEVGRGSFFGPVVAAAVILEPGYRIRGLRDSKLLPAATREELAARIREHSVAISIATVDAARIDQLNIYHATRLAMKVAVQGLEPAPDHLLADAMVVDFPCAQTKIIHGDALSATIAAASIVAKVYRDDLIRQWDPVFPAYDLASNKGYRSPKHVAALHELGPTPLHRQSFAPVWLSRDAQEQFRFMEEGGAEAACGEALPDALFEDEEELGEALAVGGEHVEDGAVFDGRLAHVEHH